MAQPYCTRTEALSKSLATLTLQARWTDEQVDEDLQEAFTEVDSRLGGLGYALPFGTTNPPLVKVLSVLYSRYALLRDLFAAGQSSAEPKAAEGYLKRFEDKIEALRSGRVALLDENGASLPSTKYGVGVARNTTPVNDSPCTLLGSYVEDFDAADGLSPIQGEQ